MATWRKCAACAGRCHWENTGWVCSSCGTVWTQDHHPRYSPPSNPPRLMILTPPCNWCQENRNASCEVQTPHGFSTFMCAECAHNTGYPILAPLQEWGRQEPWLTAKQIRAYIAGNTWVYAKTMPKNPHEYVLLHRSTDPWTHLRFVGYIREHGEQRKWGSGRWSRWHSYWSIDAHEYWTLRVQDTILNRRSLEDGKEEL